MRPPTHEPVGSAAAGSQPDVPRPGAPCPPISVVLADDHPVVRAGLRILLESDGTIDVLGEAGDIAGTVTQVRMLGPQVLVLDLNMGGESSLDVVGLLRAENPETQIVILTMQEDPAFAMAAVRSGASGYVLKDAAEVELRNAIAMAAVGRTYVNPKLGARLAALPAGGDSRPDNLSPREVEVLALIAHGHTNNEIAAALALSVRTVESHRAHIQQKVGLTTRAELVGYARDRGLFD